MNLFTRGACALGLMFVPSLMFGAPILTGDVSLGAGAQLVAVNGSDIDFDYSGGIVGTNPPIATGTVDGSGDSGMFVVSSSDLTGLTGGTATVADLNTTTEPVGVPGLSIADFIMFSATPSYSITLTELYAGTGTAAACTGGFNVCTPAANSPFNLLNEAGGNVAVSFAFSGTLLDTGTTPTSTGTVTGTFQTTFSGTTVQAILAALAPPNNEAVASAPSGTLNITANPLVPEPGTSAMMFLASGALIGLSRIRRRRNS